MPFKPRPTVAPTDDIEQLLLLLDSPPQERYEGLRPVVLFGQLGYRGVDYGIW